jgi:hypothetical protein
MVQYFEVKDEDFIERMLPWQKRGLQFTSTGYGDKIPTINVVKHNNRFKRVYCVIHSNVGSLYIMHKGGKLFLR